ncbi:hypothetical protein ACIBL3_37710 [Kribbella sp. NPDC050124]|uniref:hypothetical protein n=1 Tax=Kribbella sp. NPDC050124 TaxID=3364114 RepID=UPI0037A31AF6
MQDQQSAVAHLRATFDNLTLPTNETLTSDLYIDNVSVAVTESVTANGATPAIMDQEAHYAAAAGIDYWAFLCSPQDPLSRARNWYLSSAYKNDVNWCARTPAALLPLRRHPR